MGRLDEGHKRPHRVIDTWQHLEGKHPGWEVTFVGDGPERKNLENQVKCLGLKHVSFVGFQNPVPYYERASILMLTSDMEGFPLVLAECMSFGVVPIVYASYPAVYDIIKDGEDGLVIPKEDKFPVDTAIRKMSSLMDNASLWLKMALSAIRKSKRYSISTICGEWEQNFRSLIN